MRRERAKTGISTSEWNLLLGGLVLLVAAVIGAVAAEDAGGPRRWLGVAGIVALVVCAAAHAARIHRNGVTASLPASVGRAPVPVGTARGFAAATIAFALVLPLATATVLLALVEWAWLTVAGVLVLGCACAIATRPRRPRSTTTAGRASRRRRTSCFGGCACARTWSSPS